MSSWSFTLIESPHCHGLGIFNEDDHEKRDDRRAGIDDQLPGIAESKHWIQNAG
jgi:hypothetical protein